MVLSTSSCEEYSNVHHNRRRRLVAYIDLGCYYLVGIPVGYLIAFPLRGGVQGMWGSMLTGVGLQTLILVAITLHTNQNKEAHRRRPRFHMMERSAPHVQHICPDAMRVEWHGSILSLDALIFREFGHHLGLYDCSSIMLVPCNRKNGYMIPR